MRKRKVTYPVAKTATKRVTPAGLAGETPYVRPGAVTINLNARAGGGDFAVGDRVRIVAAGLYSGESAVVERVARGVIPAALVRTDAGGTRRVRTIDLERLPDEPKQGTPKPDVQPPAAE